MTQKGEDGTRLGGVYRRLFLEFPWWVVLALGVAAIGLGASITAKPFASLGVLVALVGAAFIVVGLTELGAADTRIEQGIGLGAVVVGIVLLVSPGLTVRSLAVVIGVTLVAGGVARTLAGLIGGGPDGRLIPLLSGVSRIIFGVLALSWPDITVLVTSLLVGPAVMIFGITQITGALRRRHGVGDPAGKRKRPKWLRVAGVMGSLAAALLLLLVSALIHRSSSEPDAFYDPPDAPPASAGILIRSESFSTGIPGTAKAWRILYTTTRDDRTPAVASAIVMVSKTAPDGPRPVIAWAHGTTGFAPKCAPTLLKNPLAAGAMPALDQVIANGWVLVATDYVGLGTKGPHPYLIGDPVGRSVLDAVRAARRLDGVAMEDRTVVWGHSQGGGAALWTGILAPRYAADVNVIGVAALAPATQLPPIFDAVKDSPVGKIMGSYVLSAYSAVYPDVKFDDYIRPAAQVLARETAGRCLSGPEALVSIGTAVGAEPYFAKSPATGPLGQRLLENIPTGRIEAPLLLAQGTADALVIPAEQQRFVTGRCDDGQQLDYRTYAGLDHVGLVLNPDSALIPDLLAWTQDRLDGTPVETGCTTAER